ncbi:MAG TPA: EamA family transporter [Candidatus Binatia bacterium]|nr:EamA family transporter [Candidatus Binatia bacterium]
MPPAPPSAALVWGALSIVYVVWGSTYLAIRIAIETLPPFLMAGTRHLCAGILLYAWAIRRGDVEGDRPGPTQWRAAAIVGAALLVGGNGGVVWAEKYVASGVAALMVATLPLWMAVLGRTIWNEPLSRVTFVGLVIGLGGLALLIGPVEGGGVDPLGALACMGAALSWAAGSLYARRAPLPKRALVATSMEMLTGGALLIVAGLVTGELREIDPSRFSTSSLLALAYLTVFGSLLAFSAYIWVLGNAPVSLVSTYAYVNPVVAVFLGWLFLDEPITGRMVLAGGIIIAAVALIASNAPKQAKPTDAS